MATNLKLIREVRISNGTDECTLQVFSADEGVFCTESTDRFCDGLRQLADDSDYSIVDMLRDAGSEYEIFDQETDR